MGKDSGFYLEYDVYVLSYLFEFILAEKGLPEIFSSIGLFTEGIATLEMPLS